MLNLLRQRKATLGTELQLRSLLPSETPEKLRETCQSCLPRSIPHNNDSVAFDYTGNISANFAGLITPNSYAQSSVDETDSEGRPRLLTQVEADDLLNGRRYMAVYGMGQYYDIFGNPHWFHFCQWKGYLTGGNFQCIPMRELQLHRGRKTAGSALALSRQF